MTDSCYTARWTSHKKVDMYRVEQVQKNTLAEDTLGFEMLYEDFSLVKSEFKESDIADGFIEHGEYTGGYRAIDDLTHIAGWKASSLQWVEGWLGGMAATGQEGQIAGAISTPVIDLNNNDGECNVTVRAWGQEDDWLVIQGASPACYAGIRFPAGGFVEETVTLPCCSKKESLTFYSNNYYPFLIDYIRITQDLKAGETVSVVTASLHTPDAETQSVVMNNPNFGEARGGLPCDGSPLPPWRPEGHCRLRTLRSDGGSWSDHLRPSGPRIRGLGLARNRWCCPHHSL